MAAGTQGTDIAARHGGARRWEYTTYAPKGVTCPACLMPIERMDLVRRGAIERESGADDVCYQHVDCDGP